MSQFTKEVAYELSKVVGDSYARTEQLKEAWAEYEKLLYREAYPGQFPLSVSEVTRLQFVSI